MKFASSTAAASIQVRFFFELEENKFVCIYQLHGVEFQDDLHKPDLVL